MRDVFWVFLGGILAGPFVTYTLLRWTGLRRNWLEEVKR